MKESGREGADGAEWTWGVVLSASKDVSGGEDKVGGIRGQTWVRTFAKESRWLGGLGYSYGPLNAKTESRVRAVNITCF